MILVIKTRSTDNNTSLFCGMYAAYKHCDGGHELQRSRTACDSVQIYPNGSCGVRSCVNVKNWEA